MEDINWWLVGIAAVVVISFLRQKANPMLEISLAELPEAVRQEVDRLVPDFAPESIRQRKDQRKASLRGDYRGFPAHFEAEFDGGGKLLEREFETRSGPRSAAEDAGAELPGPAAAEIARVLGEHAGSFERRRLRASKLGDEAAFEVKGLAGDFEWEIEVTGDGRLLEFEQERRRR